MVSSKQQLIAENPENALHEHGALFHAYLKRSPVRRLFESWVLDMALLCERVSSSKITEGQFFGDLELCRARLKFYASTGELSRDIDRLTDVLVGIERMDEPDGEEADSVAPDSESGTGFANTNSNS